MKKLVSLAVAVTFAASVFCTSMVSAAGNDLNGADKFLKEKFNVESSKEFKQLRAKTDELGMKHVKLQQIVNGIPVIGGEYIVHFDKNGKVYASNGSYDTKAKAAKTNGNFIKASEAIEIAKTEVNFTNGDAYQPDTFGAELYLYEVDGEYTPVYVTTIDWLHEDSFGNEVVYVNAETGKVVNKYSKINYGKPSTGGTVPTTGTNVTGTGIGVTGNTQDLSLLLNSGKYYMIDKTRGTGIQTYTCSNGTSLPGTIISDIDTNFNATTQKAAVDAHAFAADVYDYYMTLGRNSINGSGMLIKSSVNYSRSYVNAFWNGSQMVYGDGDGVQALALSGGLDVVAHEMSHGVTSNESNLVYQNQSGALNEAFSDIMGTAVEFYAQPTKADWLMGEDIWTPGTPNDALRSMSDPNAYGDPATMSQYVNTTQDNGGVHTNSGIINKAAYNIGSQIGADKMGKIFYRANCNYWTSSTNFAGARTGCLQAAADLYGAGSTEYNAVANGFSAVGIN